MCSLMGINSLHSFIFSTCFRLRHTVRLRAFGRAVLCDVLAIIATLPLREVFSFKFRQSVAKAKIISFSPNAGQRTTHKTAPRVATAPIKFRSFSVIGESDSRPYRKDTTKRANPKAPDVATGSEDILWSPSFSKISALHYQFELKLVFTSLPGIKG